MEPTSEVKKVTVEDAREKGLERINKLLNFVAPVFAPEKLAAAGVGAVKEKWEKSETKKQIDRFAEKAGRAVNRLERRWDRTRERVTTVAKEQAKRAAVLGLRPVVGAESAIRWMVSDLLVLRESFADKYVYEPKQQELKEHLKRVMETRERSKERTENYRERGKKMVGVRKLAESLQTKG